MCFKYDQLQHVPAYLTKSVLMFAQARNSCFATESDFVQFRLRLSRTIREEKPIDSECHLSMTFDRDRQIGCLSVVDGRSAIARFFFANCDNILQASPKGDAFSNILNKIL